jgi:hypothetical protein
MSIRSHMQIMALLALLGLGSSAAAVAEPVVTRAFIESQFLQYDKDRANKKAQRVERLSALQTRLFDLQSRGYSMQCSAQMLNETDWLLDSTSNFARADKNLWLLELTLGNREQDFALGQLEVDGSWGVCYDEWFKKLDPMINAINQFSEIGTPLRYSIVSFLKPISTPELLSVYLSNILVSDISKTGISSRDELNATTSLIAEVLYKERIRDYFVRNITGRPIASSYMEAFDAFIENWQDQETGYWGAWYRSGDQVLKSRDLSMTYHIIAYRSGDVKLWDKIFDTTLQISDDEYPYGWLQNGTLTNHHAYDVARILKLGWNKVSGERREKAVPALERLLAYGLSQGINADNSVTPQARFSHGIDDAYYYAVSLLTTIGYCSTERPFWTDAAWPEATTRCCALAGHIEAQNARTPTIEAALQRLRGAISNCVSAEVQSADDSIDSLKLDDQGGR